MTAPPMADLNRVKTHCPNRNPNPLRTVIGSELRAHRSVTVPLDR